MRRALIVSACLLMIAGSISDSFKKNEIDAAASLPTLKKKTAQIVTMVIPQGYYKDTYKKFQDKLKAKENIILEIQVIANDTQYYNLVKAKIAAGELPDLIIENVPTQYEEIAASKNMVDLTNERWVERLENPDILRARDTKIYAWPMASYSYYAAAYYNKKIFADLGLNEPRKYAEFLDVLGTIKLKGYGITPIYMSNRDIWTTRIFVSAGLPVLLGDKAQETWDKLLTNQLKWTEIPEFNTILSLYSDLYDKGYVNQDHATATFEDAVKALAAGKAAMVFNGEWTVGKLVSQYNMNPDDIGAFVVPFGNRDIMPIGSFIEGWLIPKKAKNIDGAKKVLDLLSQPAYMDIYFSEYPGFPGFKDVNGGEVASAVKTLEQKYIKGHKYIYEMDGPMSFVNELFADGLWGPYLDMVTGEKTPEQVIESWQAIYAEYMKQKQRPGF